MTKPHWRAIGSGLAVTLYLAFRVVLINVRDFSTDEIQHMQAAWRLTQGQVLYKDFFEHHGPLWYLLLKPIPFLFSDPIASLYAGRVLMAAFWMGTLILQSRLGAPEIGRKTRLLSVLFLASFSTFGARSLEIRPDVVAGFVVSLLLVISQKRLSMGQWTTMGILTGATLFITPKIVFVLGGYYIGIWLYRREELKTPQVAAFLTSVLIPIVMIAIHEWRLGASSGFLNWFFIYNAHLKNIFPWNTWNGPMGSLAENPALWSLALWGLWIHRNTPKGVAFAVGLAGIPFIKPFPFNWYFLLFAPLLCLHAAQACMETMEPPENEAPIPKFWLLSLLTIGMTFSFGYQWAELHHTNQDMKVRIRSVMAETSPHDMIMDTNTGDALFRPCPSFFSWINPDFEATLGKERTEAIFLDALTRPECKGFIWDAPFMQRHPGLASFAKDHYHPGKCGFLFLRNEVKNSVT